MIFFTSMKEENFSLMTQCGTFCNYYDNQFK